MGEERSGGRRRVLSRYLGPGEDATHNGSVSVVNVFFRSLGYSELFSLSRDEVLDALKVRFLKCGAKRRTSKDLARKNPCGA